MKEESTHVRSGRTNRGDHESQALTRFGATVSGGDKLFHRGGAPDRARQLSRDRRHGVGVVGEVFGDKDSLPEPRRAGDAPERRFHAVDHVARGADLGPRFASPTARKSIVTLIGCPRFADLRLLHL